MLYELTTTHPNGFRTFQVITADALRLVTLQPNQSVKDVTPYLITK